MSKHHKGSHKHDKEHAASNDALGALREEITEKAINIVQTVMPAKVLKLDELFAKHPDFNIDFAKVSDPVVFTLAKDTKDDEVSKKRKISDSAHAANDNSTINTTEVPANNNILKMLDVLKGELLELIEMINTVKIWIQLNIPRIEDGNNFGVSIQEETVNELGRAEDVGFNALEAMTKYFLSRAKIVSKVLKYPGIVDYRHSLKELDEKEYINLRLCCLDLRNNYAILHDMIMKNMEKIKTPRSNNHLASIF